MKEEISLSLPESHCGHQLMYEAPSLNCWNYHVQFSVVCVDH